MMNSVREELRLSREESLRSRESHDELRIYMREQSLRNERFTQDLMNGFRAFLSEHSAAARAVADELRDLRAESRARREALLRMLDRLGPGPASA